MTDVHAEVVAETGAGVVVGVRWRQLDSPKPMELFQVLQLRDGKVVDMQDHDDRRSACKAIGARP